MQPNHHSGGPSVAALLSSGGFKRQSARMKSVSPAILFGLAAVGGVYFGLFSCGGYTWHWQAFLALAFASAVAVLIGSSRYTITWRVAAVPVAVLLFVLVQAASASFHPNAPSSWDDFGVKLIRALEYGSC